MAGRQTPLFAVQGECRNRLNKYIISCLDRMLIKNPDAAIYVMGDFNMLDCSAFARSMRFSQVVKTATRGGNILDKLFTNCPQYYESAVILPPIGKSDHRCVLVNPVVRSDTKQTKSKTYCTRRFDEHRINRIGDELRIVNWQIMYRTDDCQLQADFFYSNLLRIFDSVTPEQS